MPRIIDAKNFHTADVTSNSIESYVAGTPKLKPGLIAIEIETGAESEEVYSDGEVEDEIYGTVVKSGKITLAYMTGEDKVEFFGGEIDADGVYFPPGEVQTVHKALGFQAPTKDKTKGMSNKYVWYYDVVFSYPKESAETKENKPKPQQVELDFKCYKNLKLNTHVAELDMNGEKANKVAEGKWFTEVPIKKATTASTVSK